MNVDSDVLKSKCDDVLGVLQLRTPHAYKGIPSYASFHPPYDFEQVDEMAFDRRWVPIPSRNRLDTQALKAKHHFVADPDWEPPIKSLQERVPKPRPDGVKLRSVEAIVNDSQRRKMVQLQVPPQRTQPKSPRPQQPTSAIPKVMDFLNSITATNRPSPPKKSVHSSTKNSALTKKSSAMPLKPKPDTDVDLFFTQKYLAKGMDDPAATRQLEDLFKMTHIPARPVLRFHLTVRKRKEDPTNDLKKSKSAQDTPNEATTPFSLPTGAIPTEFIRTMKIPKKSKSDNTTPPPLSQSVQPAAVSQHRQVKAMELEEGETVSPSPSPRHPAPATTTVTPVTTTIAASTPAVAPTSTSSPVKRPREEEPRRKSSSTSVTKIASSSSSSSATSINTSVKRQRSDSKRDQEKQPSSTSSSTHKRRSSSSSRRDSTSKRRHRRSRSRSKSPKRRQVSHSPVSRSRSRSPSRKRRSSSSSSSSTDANRRRDRHRRSSRSSSTAAAPPTAPPAITTTSKKDDQRVYPPATADNAETTEQFRLFSMMFHKLALKYKRRGDTADSEWAAMLDHFQAFLNYMLAFYFQDRLAKDGSITNWESLHPFTEVLEKKLRRAKDLEGSHRRNTLLYGLLLRLNAMVHFYVFSRREGHARSKVGRLATADDGKKEEMSKMIQKVLAGHERAYATLRESDKYLTFPDLQKHFPSTYHQVCELGKVGPGIVIGGEAGTSIGPMFPLTPYARLHHASIMAKCILQEFVDLNHVSYQPITKPEEFMD
ncbi:hypothetical protein DM01DRAFT_1340520 [Hesseltinella vesiculosa]|uniref:Uncharacterized protein n=1 Tax=Hesseltinella vesiculosa TaxID=101127 RepID=A0A1X2G512_9FUNG|nr:hypothetical protein DM01DRAFT_1340520 [Hesseltinella vesiculosa]